MDNNYNIKGNNYPVNSISIELANRNKIDIKNSNDKNLNYNINKISLNKLESKTNSNTLPVPVNNKLQSYHPNNSKDIDVDLLYSELNKLPNNTSYHNLTSYLAGKHITENVIKLYEGEEVKVDNIINDVTDDVVYEGLKSLTKSLIIVGGVILELPAETATTAAVIITETPGFISCINKEQELMSSNNIFNVENMNKAHSFCFAKTTLGVVIKTNNFIDGVKYAIGSKTIDFFQPEYQKASPIITHTFKNDDFLHITKYPKISFELINDGLNIVYRSGAYVFYYTEGTVIKYTDNIILKPSLNVINTAISPIKYLSNTIIDNGKFSYYILNSFGKSVINGHGMDWLKGKYNPDILIETNKNIIKNNNKLLNDSIKNNFENYPKNLIDETIKFINGDSGLCYKTITQIQNQKDLDINNIKFNKIDLVNRYNEIKKYINGSLNLDELYVFLEKYFNIYIDEYGNFQLINNKYLDEYVKNNKNNNVDNDFEIKLNEKGEILVNNKVVDLKNPNSLGESENNKFEYLIKEELKQQNDIDFNSVLNKLQNVEEVLSVISIAKHWKNMSKIQRSMAVVGVCCRLYSHYKQANSSQPINSQGMQTVMSFISLAGKIEAGTLTFSDVVLTGAELKFGVNLSHTKNFLNMSYDKMKGLEVDKTAYTMEGIICGLEIASNWFPPLKIIVVIYNIGNLVFDLFSKQWSNKVMGIDFSVDARYTWSFRWKCTYSNSFFDINVNAYRGHLRNANKDAINKVKKLLPYKTAEIIGVPIEAFNEKPSSSYGKWKLYYYSDEFKKFFDSNNNVSEEDRKILDDPNVDTKNKIKIYEKYKRKRTQQQKNNSNSFVDKESQLYKNCIGNYSRFGVIIFANKVLFIEEFKFENIMNSIKQSLISNLGNTIVYLDYEIKNFLEKPFEYTYLKSKQIIFGFFTTFVGSMATNHIQTTISIMSFMDNIADNVFKYVICPSISSVLSILSLLSYDLVKKSSMTLKDRVSSSLRLIATSSSSAFFSFVNDKSVKSVVKSIDKLIQKIDKSLLLNSTLIMKAVKTIETSILACVKHTMVFISNLVAQGVAALNYLVPGMGQIVGPLLSSIFFSLCYRLFSNNGSDVDILKDCPYKSGIDIKIYGKKMLNKLKYNNSLKRTSLEYRKSIKQFKNVRSGINILIENKKKLKIFKSKHNKKIYLPL